VLLFPFY
ncbi:anaphase-promoting complex subunit 4, partial [Nephila pilipes]